MLSFIVNMCCRAVLIRAVGVVVHSKHLLSCCSDSILLFSKGRLSEDKSNTVNLLLQRERQVAVCRRSVTSYVQTSLKAKDDKPCSDLSTGEV